LVDQGMETRQGLGPPTHGSPLSKHKNAARAALCAILNPGDQTRSLNLQ